MKIKYWKIRKQHIKSLEYIIQLKLNVTAKQIRPRCDNRRGKCTFEGDSLQLGQTLFEFAASYTAKRKLERLQFSTSSSFFKI